MLVFKIHHSRQRRLQLVAEMVVVPSHTHPEVEVVDTDVDGLYADLMVVVEHAVFTVALVVDVNVVATEVVGECRSGEM